MSCSHQTTPESSTDDAIARPSGEGRVRRMLPMLPMLGMTHGRRSAVTCHLKCDDACSKPAPNTSENSTFQDIARDLSRRNILKGAGMMALLGAGSFTLAACAGPESAEAATMDAADRDKVNGYVRKANTAFGFIPIKPVDRTVDIVTVPEGFESSVIIRWGDPLFHGVPDFDPSKQTAALQAKRFGYNNDYLDIVPLNGRTTKAATRALLTCNHEYTNYKIMFPENPSPAQHLENLRVTMQAQGFAVVDLKRSKSGATWKPVVGGTHNRRITATTEFTLDGPAAGDALLQTAIDPSGKKVFGTFANCSGGTTPWGTIVSGEENFPGYFKAPKSPANDRYGFKSGDTSYEWEKIDPRFDAMGPGKENEPNRFGYIVEVDPHDPNSIPVKHTNLGRFCHEGANVTINDQGHAVAYMGDDSRFEYIYRFISADKVKPGDHAHNKTLLSKGDLYVAKFGDDSTKPVGEWLPLIKDGKSTVPGMTVEEVCVHTRLAADKVGPTKMDRPEDVDINRRTGKIYAACTNNTERKVGDTNGPNPRPANKNGHIIEITETEDVNKFEWTILLLCGDPAEAKQHVGSVEIPVAPISSPDNLAFDSQGNMWISTDGQPGVLGVSDGLFRMFLDGEKRGSIEQFLAVPTGAETCGPVIHDQDGSVFVAVQHPGEDGAFSKPQSIWPDQVTGSPKSGQFKGPRPSVVQVTRKK